MKTYIALYKGNKITVDADTLQQARNEAALKLRVRCGREHEVSVYQIDREETLHDQLAVHEKF